jgi:hypothetical protein
MYHLSISTLEGLPVAAGAGLPDEPWRAALLRLYQAALPAGSPAREIVRLDFPPEGLRVVTTVVVLGYWTPNGLRTRDPEVRITVDPPQPY